MKSKIMKKNMIKCAALVLTIMTAIGLAGCGKNSKSDLEYVKDKGTLVVGLDDTLWDLEIRMTSLSDLILT